jgi:anti-anti-sigma regulatory factor
VTYTAPCVTELQIVTVEGELDPPAVIALQRRITVALDVRSGFVVVDLAAITGPRGRTMSLFCGALRRVNRRGARLAIVGAQAAIRSALERCAIDGVELYPTLASAVAAAGHNGTPAPVPGPAVLGPAEHRAPASRARHARVRTGPRDGR